jgi:soluble lytic murein transglycosylase-like protein
MVKWIHDSLKIGHKGYTPTVGAPQSNGRGRYYKPPPPPPKQVVKKSSSKTPLILIVCSAFVLAAALPLYFSYSVSTAAVFYKPPRAIELEPLENWQDRLLTDLTIVSKRRAQSQFRIALVQYDFIKSLVTRTRGANVDPDIFARLAIEYATAYRLDPILVAAVTYAESAFRTQARSNVGAMGLMQIMPKTGLFIANKAGEPWQGISSLQDPQTNISFGVFYLRYLYDKFDGQIPYVLAAYNWGPGNVYKFKAGQKLSMPAETRNYVKKITRLSNLWNNELAAKRESSQNGS